MKQYVTLLMLAGCALTTAVAQVPLERIRRDSLPETKLVDPMPRIRPENSFYRSPTDPPNVVRASLDNMPIKAPDSTIDYLIKQAYPVRKPRPLPQPRSPKNDRDERN